MFQTWPDARGRVYASDHDLPRSPGCHSKYVPSPTNLVVSSLTNDGVEQIDHLVAYLTAFGLILQARYKVHSPGLMFQDKRRLFEAFHSPCSCGPSGFPSGIHCESMNSQSQCVPPLTFRSASWMGICETSYAVKLGWRMRNIPRVIGMLGIMASVTHLYTGKLKYYRSSVPDCKFQVELGVWFRGTNSDLLPMIDYNTATDLILIGAHCFYLKAHRKAGVFFLQFRLLMLTPLHH